MNGFLQGVFELFQGGSNSAQKKVDDLYREFLAGVFALPEPPTPGRFEADLTAFTDSDETALMDATTAWLKSVQDQGARDFIARETAWLADGLERKQNELDDIGITSFVERHFSIEYEPARYMCSDQDCVYVKLNHGFWEDLYALFVKPAQQDRPRRLSLDISRAGTVESGFLCALVYLFRHFSQATADGTAFRGVYVAGGVINGGLPHRHLMDSFETARPIAQTLVAGAAVGAAAFFAKLSGPGCIHLDDGCLPKYGHETGVLRDILKVHADASDRIIFVVPVHLRGIRLNVSAAPDQQVLHVSRRLVHESWIATLHTVASHILARMLSGERVLVITQCGPFAALLGLYLGRAARELRLQPGQLAYFDLGQVTDFANQEESGPWLTNHRHAIEDTGLFVRAR